MQFSMPSVGKWIAIALSLMIGAGALYLRSRISQPEKTEEGYKAAKKKRNLLMMAGVLALWLCSGLVLGCFQLGSRAFTVEISPARMDILGYSVSSSVVVTWIVIAALTVFALFVRFFAVPRFQETPRGLQLVLETAVSAINNLTKEKYGHENEGLASYFFAIAALFLGSAIVELFGIRPPTTDLSMTFSYALVTFVLINVYGIYKKGVKGRLQSFVRPKAIIAPFKLLSDLAVPISLCLPTLWQYAWRSGCGRADLFCAWCVFGRHPRRCSVCILTPSTR
ncbi:MAG: F0F1 ATP synthase subunit A [Eubacteriales bacterium]